MPPTLVNEWAVSAHCPDCGALSVFDFKHASGEFGIIVVPGAHQYQGNTYHAIAYRLLRCSGCNRGALSKIHYSPNVAGVPHTLETFDPRALPRAPLPTGIPVGIQKEYREAELCVSAGAWRGASALLRSTLEKTLKANGYKTGSLEKKIDDAAADGVITQARKQKAHDDIRVLGNEVVHDEWKAVTEAEVQSALHYAQRVLEDLYDDRAAVEAVLKAKGRIP